MQFPYHTGLHLFRDLDGDVTEGVERVRSYKRELQNKRIRYEVDDAGYLVLISAEDVGPHGYNRAADGALRDKWGYPVNTLNVCNGKLRSTCYRFYDVKDMPMFHPYYIHKRARINRATYRRGYSRRGEPRKERACA